MHKVKKLKFSLYVRVICNVLIPRRAEMVGRMDIYKHKLLHYRMSSCKDVKLCSKIWRRNLVPWQSQLSCFDGYFIYSFVIHFHSFCQMHSLRCMRRHEVEIFTRKI